MRAGPRPPVPPCAQRRPAGRKLSEISTKKSMSFARVEVAGGSSPGQRLPGCPSCAPCRTPLGPPRTSPQDASARAALLPAASACYWIQAIPHLRALCSSACHCFAWDPSPFAGNRIINPLAVPIRGPCRRQNLPPSAPRPCPRRFILRPESRQLGMGEADFNFDARHPGLRHPVRVARHGLHCGACTATRPASRPRCAPPC